MASKRVEEALASEDARFAAMAKSDVKALAGLLADDLRYTHANSIFEDKDEFIRKITSGERNYLQVNLVERETVEKPGFVMTLGRLAVEVDRKAGKIENVLRYTAIYCDDDNGKISVWHASFDKS